MFLWLPFTFIYQTVSFKFAVYPWKVYHNEVVSAADYSHSKKLFHQNLPTGGEAVRKLSFTKVFILLRQLPESEKFFYLECLWNIYSHFPAHETSETMEDS